MAIQIGNQGTVTINTNVIVSTAKESFAFQVYVDEQVCIQEVDNTVVYSLSPELTIGSTTYIDSLLTIPTTYNAISNPNGGNEYLTLTGNTITGTALCG